MKTTKTSKTKKATNPTVPDNPLAPKVDIIDNPLSSPTMQELVMSPSEEVEKKVEIISEIESLATITKQQLSVRRQRIELEVENKKLDTAKKTIGAIENIIDTVMKAETLEEVSKKIKTPMDLKMMAEAAERLTGTLKSLMGGSVVDEFGNKKKQKINFMFKTSGTVQGAIQIDNSND